MSDHSNFMKEAIDLALQSAEEGTGPFGAIVVKDGEIISRGHNQVTEKNDPTSHAEIEAIREASRHSNNFNLEGCAIYTSSYPCPMCLAALYWAKISKIYYANNIEEAEKAGFNDSFIQKEVCSPDSNAIQIEKIEIENAKEPFLLWERNPQKVNY